VFDNKENKYLIEPEVAYMLNLCKCGKTKKQRLGFARLKIK
jgi:hypothetical protein